MIQQLCQILDVSADELLGIEPVKMDGRTTEVQLMRKFRDAAELPEDDRLILTQMLDSLLEKHRITTCH